jgi:hypothetical protein
MLLSDQIRKSVVFICFRDATGVRLAGTGFFLSLPLDEDHVSILLVTALHVLDGIKRKSLDGKFLIRANLKDGKGMIIFEGELALWSIHPDDASVDVAVMPWAPPDQIEFMSVPIEMAATDDVISELEIGPGDEVIITGLFANHYGKERNIPIVRVGNIAAMPEEKVKTKAGEVDAFLIEASSIGGLSGSPVFVQLVGPRKGLGFGARSVFLLGLIHGHWDIDANKQDETLQADQFEKERVNMGIAIVVPMQKIMETVNQPKLADAREMEKARLKREASTAASSDLTGASPASTS